MSAEEKEVVIKKGDTPPRPPTKPGEILEAGDVPHPPPEKPKEQPPREAPKKED